LSAYSGKSSSRYFFSLNKNYKHNEKNSKKTKNEHNPTGVLFTTQLGAVKNVWGLAFGQGSINQAHKIDKFVKLSEVKKVHSVFCSIFKEYN
jgi:hypothetical protein